MRIKICLHIVFFSLLISGQEIKSPPPIHEPVDSAQEVIENFAPHKYDSIVDMSVYNEQLNPRKFDRNFQEKYTSADYDYTLTKPRQSLWSKIKNWISYWFSKIFKISDVETLNNITIWFIRLLSVVIIGLVVYWLIKFFINKEGNLFFSNKNKSILPEVRTITEDIHEIDFASLISKFEADKNYRYATRYQYLKLLKFLNDKGLITWDPNKTNLDYIKELSATKYANSFQRLTLIFDYVWYGEFPIDDESYGKYKQEFHQITNHYE